ALRQLEAEDPRKAALLKLRFFAGLSAAQAAAVLGVSLSTLRAADRDDSIAQEAARAGHLRRNPAHHPRGATDSGQEVPNASGAVELARKAVELAPKEGNYWNTRGAASYRAGEWKASVHALDTAMELRNGGDSFDWFFLAMGHWRLGEKDKGRQWYDR